MCKANNSELHHHLEAIYAVRCKCILCGQVMFQGSRLKTHWRASHPTAWSIAAQDAISESQSPTSIFRKPCQFCGSQAKCTKAHAGQCAALFQVLAGRRLMQRRQISEACSDSKAPALRRSETVAAYKSATLATTPLAKAFGRGKPRDDKEASAPGKSKTCDPQSLKDAPRARSAARARSAPPPPSRGTGGQVKLTQLIGRGSRSSSTGPVTGSWTLRLRLGNPHQLCYLNAGVVALLHVLQAQDLPDLRPLTGAALRSIAFSRCRSTWSYVAFSPGGTLARFSETPQKCSCI